MPPTPQQPDSAVAVQNNHGAQEQDQQAKLTGPAAPAGPSGISGWLILPAIGLVLAPVRLAYLMYTDLLPALRPATWHALTSSDSPDYHPMWAPLIGFELVANSIFLLFTLYVAYLFFSKNRRTPAFFIAWIVSSLALHATDMALVNQIPSVYSASSSFEDVKDIAKGVVGALIWIPYFLVSRRVKNTFVH